MRSSSIPTCLALALACVLARVAPGAEPAGAAAAKGPWTFTSSLTLKEGFDDNVFIQDHGDQADRDSWVTSILPSIGVAFQEDPAFKISLSYAPEAVFYHSEDSEDYVAHRGNLNLGGKAGGTAWEVLNGAVWIDGDNQGPRFTGGGDVPAIGGIPLRDRRDATIYRNSFKLTQTMGPAFVRPVINSYVHDFRTEQHQVTEPGFEGYENYIDRYDVSGGLDGGYEVVEKMWVVLGYRYGHQEQKVNQFKRESPYCNDYQRFLAGIEGTPADWLKLSVLAGPDVRDFESGTPEGFDADEQLYYIDASVSIMPTKQDTVTFVARRYEQPAFSSHSMYEDIVYDVVYRREFSGRVAAGVGFKVYGGDWQAPVNRDDWIYTPSVTLAYTHDQHLSGELAYSYDWVDSKVAGTEGREFTRNLVWLGAKYAF